MSLQGERETVLGHLLQGGIRTEHCKGRKPTERVYEGQAAKYGRTGHLDPVHGHAQDKHFRTGTGQQGDAPQANRQ